LVSGDGVEAVEAAASRNKVLSCYFLSRRRSTPVPTTSAWRWSPVSLAPVQEFARTAIPSSRRWLRVMRIAGVWIELELPSARVDGELRFKVGGARGASPVDASSTTESTRPWRRATTVAHYKASMRWGSSRSRWRRVLLTPEMDGGGVL
jgi:hypothetical protein